jgi:hypothetical protein
MSFVYNWERDQYKLAKWPSYKWLTMGGREVFFRGLKERNLVMTTVNKKKNGSG